MLDARSLAYTDPSAGGTSGIFLVGLLERLGIADAVRAKTVLCINGDEVVEKVLSGDAEVGSTFISEIVPVKGVKIVGPLPAAIENATAYAAGDHGDEFQSRSRRQVHRDAVRARAA